MSASGEPANSESGTGSMREEAIRLIAEPPYAAAMGAGILAELRDVGSIDAVVIWDNSESVVLAHVVALGLGASVVRAGAGEGLVSLLDVLPSSSRALLLAPRFQAAAGLDALETLVMDAGGVVVGVAAAFRTDALLAASSRGVPVAAGEAATRSGGGDE